MKPQLKLLEQFVIEMAAKGYIQIGEYLKLIDAIYECDKVKERISK
jgi:hypothetical protein